MNYEEVRDVLADLSLNLDIETIERVHGMLEREVGVMGSPRDKRLVVYATAAVVAENQQIPTLDRHLSSCGVTLEHVVNHLQPQQVNEFLAILDKVIGRCRCNNANLNWKVGRLRLSYRIFTKFQGIVKGLASEFGLEADLKQDLRRMSWILFCSCKFHHTEELPINQEVQLLQECLAFSVQVVAKSLRIDMGQYFKAKWQSCFPDAPIAASHMVQFPIEQLTREALKVREHTLPQLPMIIQNEVTRRRYLDDLTNQCQHLKYQHTDPHLLDEVKLLRLNKSMPLPPERICHEVETPTKFSSCRIDFDRLEFEDVETAKEPASMHQEAHHTNFSKFRQSMLVSPLIKVRQQVQMNRIALSPITQKAAMTPVSARMSSYNWANTHCSQLAKDEKEKLLALFAEVGENTYESTMAMCKKYYVLVLRQHCQQTAESRLPKLVHLTEYFLLAMSRSKSNFLNHNIEQLRSPSYLKALFCIVCVIFFFVHSLKCPELKSIASLFDTDYLQVFQLLSRASKIDSELPVPLKTHIDELERQVLLVCIWEDQTGSRLIQGDGSSSLQRILLDRLQKRIYDRLYLIQRVMSLQSNETEKVKEVVSYVLDKRPILLNRNYIDQIILCSLFAVLRQVRRESAPTMEEIFSKYSQVELSFNFYKLKAHGQQGEEMSLMEFYNSVFRPEIREVITHEYTTGKLLSTPVRAASSAFEILGKSTPSTSGKNNMLKFDDRTERHRSGYISGILHQISEKLPLTKSPVPSAEQDRQKDDVMNSPKFPEMSLQHKFSFAAIPQDDSPGGFRRNQQNSCTFGFGPGSLRNIENEEDQQ